MLFRNLVVYFQQQNFDKEVFLRNEKMFMQLASLALLYFVQGLPYGFQDKALPVFLRDHGATYSQLTLSRILLVPWLCKAGFAPLIDGYLTKYLWLALSLFGLVLTCTVGAFLSETIFNLAALLLALNTLCAVQDIASDGLAMDMLRDNAVAYGSSVQVVGYKIGALFGGGVLFFVHLQFGWIGLFIALALTYFLTLLLAFSLLSMRPDRSTSSKGHQVQSSGWNDVFSVPGTFSLALFLIVYKLGESGVLATFPIFAIDRGLRKETLGLWNGLIGQGLSLLGSLYGGIIITDRSTSKKVLRAFSSARLIPVICQCLVVCLWSSSSTGFGIVCMTSLCVLQFIGGVITTATFSVMMACSKKAHHRVQATHYTLLASVEVAAKLLFSSLTGTAVDLMGLRWVYVALLALTAAVPFVIPKS